MEIKQIPLFPYIFPYTKFTSLGTLLPRGALQGAMKVTRFWTLKIGASWRVVQCISIGAEWQNLISSSGPWSLWHGRRSYCGDCTSDCIMPLTAYLPGASGPKFSKSLSNTLNNCQMNKHWLNMFTRLHFTHLQLLIGFKTQFKQSRMQ